MNALSELTRTAAALSAYRAEHGNYPDSLDALVPTWFPAVPIDIYSDKPFLYARKGNGYLLYSVFENGIDDGGTDISGDIVVGEWRTTAEKTRVDFQKADVVLRLPRPGFPLPSWEVTQPNDK